MSGSNICVGDSGIEIPDFVGTDREAFVFTAGVTSHTFFSAPDGGSYFINRVFFQVTTDAIIAVAGTLTLTFSDSNDGPFATFQIFIPHTVAAPTVPTFGPAFETGAGFFFWPDSKETALSCTISPALTGGQLAMSMNGGTIPTFIPH